MADEVFPLEEWAVHEGPRGKFLSGIVPARHELGRIETEPIVSAEGRDVTVTSGKVYFLAEVLPEYREYLALVGLAFDPEHPIAVEYGEGALG